MTAGDNRAGRYRLGQVIGTGAFAAVYEAVDERLGDTVAVKLLGDNHCLDPEVRGRFISEGRVLRRVDSPHVVRVHDIGETDRQQPFLVLEHADRGTLADRVTGLRAQGWAPGPGDLLVVARSLAAAVEALHRADLVHRDLSPGNVLLRSTVAPLGDTAARVVAADERLVLADLGLCKDLARHSGLTRAAGTDGFRPPEQRGTSGQVDARADLWALSALMVWLVTGEPPGGARVSDAVSRAGHPKGLGAALARSLADHPGKRHADVAAWRTDVEAALGPPVEISPASAARPTGLRYSLVLLTVGGLLGAGAWRVLSGDAGDGGAMTRRDDDRVEVARERGEARIALVGPEEVDAGEDAVFQVDGEGVDRWVWLMPDGASYHDEPHVRVRTESAGEARIILVGFSASGDRLEVVHDLQVRG